MVDVCDVRRVMCDVCGITALRSVAVGQWLSDRAYSPLLPSVRTSVCGGQLCSAGCVWREACKRHRWREYAVAPGELVTTIAQLHPGGEPLPWLMHPPRVDVERT